MARKKAPMKRRSPARKTAAARPATKRAAKKKAAAKRVPAKRAAPKKAAKKKPAARKAAAPKGRAAAKKKTAKKVMRTPVSIRDWPAPLQDDVRVKVRAEGVSAPPAPERPVRSFLRQAQAAKPNEQHPGQTAEHGATNDRPGSQPERARHLYPNSNQPNSGSARSTQYKGKRRTPGPTPEE